MPSGHTLSEDEDEERPGDQGFSVTLPGDRKWGFRCVWLIQGRVRVQENRN